MIVKDEAPIISRCLQSVKHLIDYWVICDTGSTDGTQHIIKNEMNNIPGELISHEWVDFGHNRSMALHEARGKAEYTLLLDSDQIVIPNGFNKYELNEDAYYVQYEDAGLDYWKLVLLNNSFAWYFKGVTHEYVTCDKHTNNVRHPSLKIYNYDDGSSHAKKFERDVELLEKAIQEEPLNPRYAFYLAQSYRGLKNFEKARQWYKRRIAIGGWDQETWYAMYQYALSIEEDINSSLEHFLTAYSFRPTRAEPLYEIAKRYRQKKQYHLGYLFADAAHKIPYPNDSLFVHSWIYNVGIKDELAVCSHYVGEYEKSAKLCLEIQDKVFGHERLRVKKNRMLAKQKIVNRDFKKNIVIGLGSGRCGTKSLHTLFNLQPFFMSKHEGYRLPWEFDQERFEQALSGLQNSEFEISCDVGLYWLRYVPKVLFRFPDAKFVCMVRDKTETVNSYMAWTVKKNHWTDPDSQAWTDEWKPDEWDECYPKYPLEKRTAIGTYYDDYYSLANYYSIQYKENFQVFQVDSLNNKKGQSSILDFLEVPKNERVLAEQIHMNKFHLMQRQPDNPMA